MEPLSPVTKAVLELVQALVPALTAVAGGLWVAYTYLQQKKEAQVQQKIQAERENRTRLIEAQKPFAQRRLETYTETSRIVGTLVALDKSTEKWAANREWINALKRFHELYWTDMSIVEDDQVKKAMQEFSEQLDLVIYGPTNTNHYEPIKANQEELKQRAYRLSRGIRASIERTWEL